MQAIGLLTVLALAAVELWAAIPAGLALKLHPLVVAVVAATGAMAGMVVVVVLGGRIRSLLLLRGHAGDGDQRHGRIYGIWERWGPMGLGLLAPLLVGAPLGTALGIALGAPRGRLLLWMSIGILSWSGVLTLVGALGLAGIEALRH
ncbi:MAG: small multi-drug export protein [Chloroflexota bacterium]